MKTTIKGIAVVAAASVALCRASTAAADEAMRLNAQGFKLLKVCAGEQKDRNAFVAPYSIDSAFCLLWLGAEGESKRQIEETLGYPDGAAEWFVRTAESLAAGVGSGEAAPYVSNSVWLDQSVIASSNYQDEVKSHFMALPQRFDRFIPVEFAGCVNTYVCHTTSFKVWDVLSPESVAPDARMVLVSAFCFDGRWMKPFSRDALKRDCTFFLADGKTSTVDMLADNRLVPYAEDDTCQAIKLDYRGGRFSYVIVLPKEGHDVGEIVDRFLTGDEVPRLVSSFKDEETAVSIPVMGVDIKASFKDPLKKLGMSRPFEPSGDFGRIADDTGRGVDKVDDVVRKTYFNIADMGTHMNGDARPIMPRFPPAEESKPSKVFKADRPHVGFLYDARTGLVLLCGVVRSPRRNGYSIYPLALSSRRVEAKLPIPPDGPGCVLKYRTEDVYCVKALATRVEAGSEKSRGRAMPWYRLVVKDDLPHGKYKLNDVFELYDDLNAPLEGLRVGDYVWLVFDKKTNEFVDIKPDGAADGCYGAGSSSKSRKTNGIPKLQGYVF